MFSNASGSYSSNVNLAVENSSWQDEQQLQEMYLKRKSFAFNSDRWGFQQNPLQRSMQGLEAQAIVDVQHALPPEFPHQACMSSHAYLLATRSRHAVNFPKDGYKLGTKSTAGPEQSQSGYKYLH